MTKHYTNTSDLLSVPKKKSIWSYLFTIFLLVVIAFSVFVGVKQSSLKKEKIKIEEILVKLDKEITKQENKKGYNQQQALKNGQDIFNQAKKHRIKWSQIYKDVISIENQATLFYNIESTREKKFNISGITNSLDNISKLLKIIKSNQKFKDPFISQITEIRKADEKAYNFMLSFEYITKNPKK